MAAKKIDVREVIGRAAAVIALHVSYEASQDLRQANAAVTEAFSLLREIQAAHVRASSGAAFATAYSERIAAKADALLARVGGA